MCRGCAIESVLPKTGVVTMIHEHPLDLGSNRPVPWMCCNTAIHGRCYSGINNSDMSKHHQFWKCSAGCQFQLCLNCALVQQKT